MRAELRQRLRAQLGQPPRLARLKTGLLLAVSLLVASLACLAQPAAGLVVEPPTGLVTTGYPLGPFAPAAQEYSLVNPLSEPVNWAAGTDQPWLSVSVEAGTLAAGQGTSVQVFLNSSALYLPAGDYSATVWFTNLAEPEAPISRTVQLSISQPDAPQVEPVALPTSQVQIYLTGGPGSTVLLESSTNLVHWQVEDMAVLDGPGVGFDLVMAREPGRFFRGISLGASAEPAVLSFRNRVTYVDDPRLVRVTGQPWGVYQLETSTDGLSWTAVATQKLCGTDQFIYTNRTAPTPDLLYRAVAVSAPVLPTVHHILIVGQSLALGTEGAPALSIEPNPQHLRFYSENGADYLNVLFEAGTETIATSAARQAALTAPELRLLFSNVGMGGADYSLLKKGTANYALGLEQFRRAPAVLACRLLRWWPSALFCVHGEGDWNNPHYDLDIRQWQQDYEADIQRLSGLPVRVPMFHTQISAWTAGGGPPHALSPYKVLAEAEAHPDRTILVGPKYFLPYALPLGQHLNNYGYRWLGAYYGKVYKRVVMDGQPWSPLRPIRITRTGAVITARFHVPVPPLVLDTNAVSDPGHYGFEYYDDSPEPPAITQVELLSEENAVRISLSAVPTGSNQRLRYAYTGVPGAPGGPFTGPRGNLRDSDSEPSLSEDPLYNWCVHFDKPIEVE